MIKQVIILRTDLNMRKGKMVAQGCHASMKVFFDRMSHMSSIGPMNDKSKEKIIIFKTLTFEQNDPMLEWMQGSFAKIVVGCNTLEELLDLEKQAKEANIPCALITDNGQTEFKETCPECSGFGVLEAENWNEFHCKFCHGTGKINKPTVTCLAIGPDQSEKIDKITGELKLL